MKILLLSPLSNRRGKKRHTLTKVPSFPGCYCRYFSIPLFFLLCAASKEFRNFRREKKALFYLMAFFSFLNTCVEKKGGKMRLYTDIFFGLSYLSMRNPWLAAAASASLIKCKTLRAHDFLAQGTRKELF